MSDYSRLMTAIATLSTKVDDLVAKVNTPTAAPPDEQPEVDAAASAVDAILAKIP